MSEQQWEVCEDCLGTGGRRYLDPEGDCLTCGGRGRRPINEAAVAYVQHENFERHDAYYQAAQRDFEENYA